MNDAIMVLNAGSSSLKFCLYALAGDLLQLQARGQIEGIGSSPRFKARDNAGNVMADINWEPAQSPQQTDHKEAFSRLAEWAHEQFAQRLRLIAVGHRVVHGGSEFATPTLIDDSVLKKLEALVPLAPLHQPHNLAGIRAVIHQRPSLPQVACFDTAFHRGRPTAFERFGLPEEFFARGVRRWGFHGLSYQFIAGQFRRIAPELAARRIIVAHLGNGASMCAMRNGLCVDTTMGFSTLDGLAMGTRCGSLDPGVILFLLQQYTPSQIEELLYKKSGLLGISGISNDVRELLSSTAPSAAEALDYFVCRAVREVGALTAALGGLDAIIFTAGIGENSPVIRQRICHGLAWLGIELDRAANERGERRISPPTASPSAWVVPTDEESVIASATLEVMRATGRLSNKPDEPRRPA